MTENLQTTKELFITTKQAPTYSFYHTVYRKADDLLWLYVERNIINTRSNFNKETSLF